MFGFTPLASVPIGDGPLADDAPRLEIFGESSGAFIVTASSTASAPVTATSSLTINVTASAAGVSTLVATSNVTIPLTGSAEGDIDSTVYGDSVRTINLSGAASGEVGAAGESNVTIPLTGSSEGVTALVVQSNQTINVEAVNTASVTISFASNGTVLMTGTSDGVVFGKIPRLSFNGDASALTTIPEVSFVSLNLPAYTTRVNTQGVATTVNHEVYATRSI